jgi:peptidoglycan/xylan/chitin deacetylase (PgdA/CDA1 family)
MVGVVVLALAAAALTRGGGDDDAAQEAAAAPVRSTRTAPAAGQDVDLGPRDMELVRMAAKGQGVLSGGGTRPAVALTFDDGPDEYTGRILDELERLQVPATFFVLGRMIEARPGDLQRIVDAGHEVAVHTWTHPDLTRLDPARAREEITRTAQALGDASGVAPRLFRPPYGAIDPRVLAQIKRERLVTLLWDVDTGDWRRPGAQAIAAEAVQKAGPGSVILLHDGGGDRSQTLEALPEIVRGLRARGFEFTTAGDLLVSDPPRASDVVDERGSSYN